ALTAQTWGFYDVLFGKKHFKFQRPYGSYVMENVLFKLSYPAEFHAQTAVECAVKLHPIVKNRLEDISRIELITHESAIRIISKQGALYNPADRDHCLQYMVAVGLLFGDLKAEHYEDDVAADPRIDALRAKMHVTENEQFSRDYHDPDKRSIANSMRIIFKDGSESELITIEYPIGHKRRREEGIPVLMSKFKRNLSTRFSTDMVEKIIHTMSDTNTLSSMKVSDFMAMWMVN
ncbi:TPA: MmgE/PrpD family protein, partial [Legionella pneumophila]|nr:MmgE/PrpD family protein [Legionella pneumophila]